MPAKEIIYAISKWDALIVIMSPIEIKDIPIPTKVSQSGLMWKSGGEIC